MIRLGLTGGIGMGKSTVSAMFAAHDIPVFNADEVVHRLQAPHGAAIPPLAAAFPALVRDGVLNRPGLRALVLAQPEKMRLLEGIMHPLVRAARADFITQASAKRAALFDIPLLFETSARAEFDKIIVVSCPREIQVERVRQRGLDLDEVHALIDRQMPDAKKRDLADYVIENGGTREATNAQVLAIIKELGL